MVTPEPSLSSSAPGGLDGTLKFFDFHGMSEAKASSAAVQQPTALGAT